MKNLLRIALAVLLVASVGVAAVSCANDGEINIDDSCNHSYNNACDANCNQCGEGREVEGHVAGADDDDCTTPIICNNCGTVMTAGKTQHVANADDGDCTTAVTCTQCAHVFKEAKSAHAFGAWQYNAEEHWHACSNESCTVTDTKAAHNKNENGVCSDCGYIIEVNAGHTCNYNLLKCDASGHWNECACGARDTVAQHTPAEGEKNCAEGVCCSVCQWLVTPVKEHTPEADDDDCTTDIKCSECGKTVEAGNTSHVDNNGDRKCDEEGCNGTVTTIGNQGANTETGWGEIITPNRKN